MWVWKSYNKNHNPWLTTHPNTMWTLTYESRRWVWLWQDCIHLYSFPSAWFHNPNTPHAVNSVWKHYCCAFSLSPCQSLAFSLLILSQGGGGERAGVWSVYPALLAWHPACLLITLYSERLRPMSGVAAGSIACDVTQHIRGGYSRLVETRKSIQTHSECKAEALLSSHLYLCPLLVHLHSCSLFHWFHRDNV